MSATRIVKRYANRKLYDTERCYVTLEDISVMIRENALVKVLDNKSGEDLTNVTLAQIIFETEKKKSFMPLNLLRNLIQQSSAAAKELAEKGEYLLSAKSLGISESTAQMVDPSAVAEDTQAANEDSPKAGLSTMVSSTKQSFEELQQFVAAKINGPDGSTARNASLGRDMEDIRRRLADLEERLAPLAEPTE
jgi:polyhydroxyalkanoate synthesis repressor PhaR